MLNINDYVWHKGLHEEVKIIGIEFDFETQKIVYICQSKYIDQLEARYWELQDLRYR